MIIAASAIEQSGPGVDLSNQTDGVSIQMSDPVADFEYALNTVTLVFDLSGVEHARLAFQAMEFGDEPHAPPPGPFGDDANFDGVAVSADGVSWYEIQGLRELRSDRYTAFDLDLDAAVAGLGLAYNGAFRIRFCQYDDNPAPMDGISIKGIQLAGDLRPPVLLLMLDDNAATATVVDASASPHHQTFVDSGGNPNTSAHSAPGRVGTALSFDGVDDRMVLTAASHKDCLGANRNFAIAFWWKTNAPVPASTTYFLSNRNDAVNSLFAYTHNGNAYFHVRFGVGVERWVGPTWAGGADNLWHHYVLMRKGTVLSFYRDGVLSVSNDHPDNPLSLAPVDRDLSLGATQTGGNPSPGFADDFRVYDRALLASEIQALAAMPA